MTYLPVQFAEQTYLSEMQGVSEQHLINMFLERNPGGSKSQTILRPTPGIKALVTVGSGPIRGIHAMGDNLFVISGEELYFVNNAFVATLIGTVEGYTSCQIIDNGTHVGIATGDRSYYANTTTIGEMTERGLLGAAYQDGYGIFTKNGTEQFYVTGIDDMTTIGALDFSSADLFADYLVGCISDHRELYLFGEKTIEVWQNTGGADFPFMRSSLGFQEIGCLNGNTIAKIGGRILFLGNDKVVYSMAGYQLQPISNPSIEKLIISTLDPSSSSAFTYHKDGHDFYVLNFQDLTLCFDLTTGLWHERQSSDELRYRVNSYEYMFSKHILGDFENGNLYEFDNDTCTDNSQYILREATSGMLFSNNDPMSFAELCIDFETGVGLTTGQGSDPKAMLEYSDNGGITWSNRIETTIGKIGEYNARARWARLGSSRNRVFRVSVTDPVQVILAGAYAKIDVRSM